VIANVITGIGKVIYFLIKLILQGNIIMTTPVIPYVDFGNLIAERYNNNTLLTLLQNFSNILFNSLHSMVVQDNSDLPNSTGKISVAFYGDPNSGSPNYGQADISLTYTPNTGPYPTGTITIYFSGPNGMADFNCVFDVEFFDTQRITITAQGAPSVTARFDASNPDPSALNIFVYAIMGVAMPVWMDQVTNGVYNNVWPTN
jgi:hypothetical protein